MRPIQGHCGEGVNVIPNSGRNFAPLPLFSLSPAREERAGRKADCFRAQIPSPRPSPRLGGERELMVVPSCTP